MPFLHIFTEIIPENSEYEAIGQVRVILPGQTGCLICSGAIDPSEATLDQISDRVREEYARIGYVRGTDQTPTPSVIHLNGVTSHLGISQLLRLVFGEELNGRDFLHYDRQSCRLIAAQTPINENCPVCGKYGYLSAGDEDSNLCVDASDKLSELNPDQNENCKITKDHSFPQEPTSEDDLLQAPVNNQENHDHSEATNDTDS